MLWGLVSSSKYSQYIAYKGWRERTNRKKINKYLYMKKHVNESDWKREYDKNASILPHRKICVSSWTNFISFIHTTGSDKANAWTFRCNKIEYWYICAYRMWVFSTFVRWLVRLGIKYTHILEWNERQIEGEIERKREGERANVCVLVCSIFGMTVVWQR